MKIEIEITDLHGNEPNYSWVKRKEIEVPSDKSDLSIVRICKKIMGYNNVKSYRDSYGDTIALNFRKSGLLHIMFINFIY